MKRILIIFIAILALASAAAFVAGRMGGEATPADTTDTSGTSPLAVAPTPEPTEWDGRAVQDINTTFMVGPHQIIIERFVYAGLNGERATVGVDAVVITPAAKPAWLDGAWVMNSATNHWKPASMKVRSTGKRHRLALSFKDLPVKRLRGSMAFSITYPDGVNGRQSFSIAPLAPSAPRTAPAATVPAEEPAPGTPATDAPSAPLETPAP